MRGSYPDFASGPTAASQGLTMGWRKQMNLKLRSREVTERKQVGDAESMINEGLSDSGHIGFFSKGEGGEV
jgi:pyruvate dehydrogenase kinase 2/3/4